MYYHDPLTHYAVTTALGAMPIGARSAREGIEMRLTEIEAELQVLSPQAMLNANRYEKIAMNSATESLLSEQKELQKRLTGYTAEEGGIVTQEQGIASAVVKQNIQKGRPLVTGTLFLLGATAMAVSYSRSQSLLRAFGASFVSLPYLLYVAIDTYKEKKK